MKKHIITIAGRPGSGKSTTAKKTAESLGYERFSSGDFFRTLSQERGLDVLAGNKHAEQDTSIDEQVDEKLRALGTSRENMVIDSRMAWHWIPESFKVYLDLDLETAAERILGGMDTERRAVEHIPDSPAEYAELLGRRLESEGARYMNMYQQNPYDTSHYDLVVDTKKNNPEQVLSIITDAYTKWLQR